MFRSSHNVTSANASSYIKTNVYCTNKRIMKDSMKELELKQEGIRTSEFFSAPPDDLFELTDSLERCSQDVMPSMASKRSPLAATHASSSSSSTESTNRWRKGHRRNLPVDQTQKFALQELDDGTRPHPPRVACLPTIAPKVHFHCLRLCLKMGQLRCLRSEARTQHGGAQATLEIPVPAVLSLVPQITANGSTTQTLRVLMLLRFDISTILLTADQHDSVAIR